MSLKWHLDNKIDYFQIKLYIIYCVVKHCVINHR